MKKGKGSKGDEEDQDEDDEGDEGSEMDVDDEEAGDRDRDEDGADELGTDEEIELAQGGGGGSKKAGQSEWFNWPSQVLLGLWWGWHSRRFGTKGLVMASSLLLWSRHEARRSTLVSHELSTSRSGG